MTRDEGQPAPLRWVPGTNPGPPMRGAVEQRLADSPEPDEEEVWLYEYWSGPQHLANETGRRSRWGQYLRRLNRRDNARRHR